MLQGHTLLMSLVSRGRLRGADSVARERPTPEQKRQIWHAAACAATRFGEAVLDGMVDASTFRNLHRFYSDPDVADIFRFACARNCNVAVDWLWRRFPQIGESWRGPRRIHILCTPEIAMYAAVLSNNPWLARFVMRHATVDAEDALLRIALALDRINVADAIVGEAPRLKRGLRDDERFSEVSRAWIRVNSSR